MRRRIGKMKIVTIALLTALLATVGTEKVIALPALDLHAGFANAWTNLNGSSSDAMGHHCGWSLSADARWVATCVALDRAAATTSTASVSILYGVRGQYIALAASNWLADGSRYRAWSAFGLGPELGIGLYTSTFILSQGQTFLVAAAVLGNVANYTQTSLYSAYISWLAEVSWALELSKCLALSAAIPLEFAFRADGQSIIAALNLGVRYAF
jgi:hypothetical protein